VDDQLALDPDPAAVRTARRFVAEAVAGTSADAVGAAAELVVTELVTNALLHAHGPVRVRVGVTHDRVRVTVSDGSRRLPHRPAGDHEGMTGRGLRLVDALTARWGVRRVHDGKSVWAEVTATVDDDATVPAALDEPDEPPTDGTRYDVVLRDVPTGLLLAANAYVDNVVRELTLARTGAESGQSGEVSPGVAAIVAAMTTGFTEAREAIKHQAVAAAEAGRERLDLTLRLPAAAAGAGRHYLRALDAADRHARASRLLVLEEPPQQRSFRRWYVSCLVGQLEAVGGGQVPPATPSLEEHLLAELGSVAAARRQAVRSARLQQATGSLASAADVPDVSRLVVSEAVAALDATAGVLVVGTSGGRLSVPAVTGCSAELVHRLRADTPPDRLPVTETVRSGQPVWLESRAECLDRYPELLEVEPTTVAVCAVPLRTGGRITGALQLTFAAARLFDADERGFVVALAAQTAQALERGQLYAGERRARADAEVAAARLVRLHEITARLAATSDTAEVADVVTAVAARTLGAVMSALCLVDDDDETMRVVGLHGGQPETMRRWSTFPVSLDLPANEVLRTRAPLVLHGRRQLEERFPLLVGQAPEDRVMVCVPLATGDRRLGSLALSFPADHTVDHAELGLLTTIANQCVLALDRATLLAAERDARTRAAFLADATAVLASSLEPPETLQHLVALVVPALSDWAVVYLVDAHGAVEAATAAHRDPALTDLLVRLQREQPPAPDGELAGVLRTGRSLRYARVPEEVRARTTAHPDLAGKEAAMAPTSGLAVPLVAEDRVIGALALARVEGSAYSVEDLRLVEQLAARGAVAIDNAQRFGRERDSALTLQRSLLPQLLPRVPGVRLAWRYLPGTAGTHVGGDWYDVVPLDEAPGDDRVALLIGDVMGRGLRAAAVMGQLRAIARTYLTVDTSPAAVLERLDVALARLEVEQIATAVLGVLEPRDRMLTLASAGHLPPLLVPGDGTSSFVHVEAGPPLGVGSGAFVERRLQLPPRSTVLLYTDGLVEDREMPVDLGMRVLAEAGAAAVGPERLCEVALSALGRDDGADDDTALLAVGLF